MAEIPVVDFSLCSVSKETVNEDTESFKQLASAVTHAFSTVGFLYLEHHGIGTETVKEVQTAARRFFLLSPLNKEKYRIQDFNGWVASEKECLKPGTPGDLKESFSYNPAQPMRWPDEEVPEFRAVAAAFQALCETLARRLMTLLAVGLGLDGYFQEASFFNDRHQSLTSANASALRWLYYHPLPADYEIKPNQLRCGEHSDYGTITLLFQDDVGGLEVMNSAGEWTPATPIPDTIVVNIGALLQRWTTDKLKATMHRVVIPTEEHGRQNGRQSLAYFIQPDDAAMIAPIDGSQKYLPISSADYILMRFNEAQEKFKTEEA